MNEPKVSEAKQKPAGSGDSKSASLASMAALAKLIAQDSAKSAIFVHLGYIEPVHFFMHFHVGIPGDFLDDMAGQVCNCLIAQDRLGRSDNVLVFHLSATTGAISATCVTPMRGNARLVQFPPGELAKALVRCLSADRSKDEHILVIKVGHTGKVPFGFDGPLLDYELPLDQLADVIGTMKALAGEIKADQNIAMAEVFTIKDFTS